MACKARLLPLWTRAESVCQEIKETGLTKTLYNIAVAEGFEQNPGNRRAYRVGIDISIWFFQINITPGGENPALRTFFFRLSRLLSIPVLPVFVYDGPNRPKFKRNNKVSTKWRSELTHPTRKMIEAFGFEWLEVLSLFVWPVVVLI